MRIEYVGEREDGSVCRKCGGVPTDATITRKIIFGRLWVVGEPQEIDMAEFDKYMATGLFVLA